MFRLCILNAMMRANEFRGLWTRSLIAWPDGRRDVSTQVAWLQGISLFADLRQPPDLASRLSTASCCNELTGEDCLALAGQQGFSGKFEARDAAYEWVRRIDYQPPQAARDIGRLFWRDQIMVEEGVETEYTEHWRRDPAVPEAPCAALWLHDEARGVFGLSAARRRLVRLCARPGRTDCRELARGAGSGRRFVTADAGFG